MGFVKQLGLQVSPMSMFYDLKELLVSVGWTVVASRGASGSGSATDEWTSAGAIAGYAWIILRMPGSTNEFAIYRQSTTLWEKWSLYYSPQAITWGGDGTPPSVVIGSSDTSTTNINEGGNWNQTGNQTALIVQDEAPWGFWVLSWLVTGNAGEVYFCLDPLEELDADDTDPYMLIVHRDGYINGDLMYFEDDNAISRGTWLYGSVDQQSDTFRTFGYIYDLDTTPSVPYRSSPGDERTLVLPIWYANLKGFKGVSIYRKYTLVDAISNGSVFTLNSTADIVHQGRIVNPWDGSGSPSEAYTFEDYEYISLGGGGGGVTLTYKKRARDSNGAAPPPPASYVYWDASNPGDAYPSPPPFGGPLVEETVLEIVES